MNLKDAPKKIKKDGLVNVVVKLHLVPVFTRVSLEKKIEEAFQTLGQPLGKFTIRNRMGNVPNDNNLHFFSNQLYKLLVEETCISFNIVDKYPGWKDMKAFIESVIASLPELHYSMVSIQYVSVFEEVLIFNQLEGRVSLPHFNQFIGSELIFHYAHEQKDVDVALVDVRLTNNMLNPQYNKHASMTDIKVRCGNKNNEWTKNEMLVRLELVHEVQHRCFFELLTKEFIDSRDPVYE